MALPSLPEMVAYIQQAAAARGMDPAKVVQVAKTEGLGRGIWQSNIVDKRGREPSYGPFQMLVGGRGTNFPAGLGNKFEAATGLKASNPASWRSMVDYALNTAAKEGWGQWYGPKNAGLGNWYGLKGATARPVSVPSGAPPAASQYDPLSSVGTPTSPFKTFASWATGQPTVPAAAPVAGKAGLMGALAGLGAGMAAPPPPPPAPSFSGVRFSGGDVILPRTEYASAQLPVWGGEPTPMGRGNPEDARMKQLLALLGRG